MQVSELTADILKELSKHYTQEEILSDRFYVSPFYFYVSPFYNDDTIAGYGVWDKSLQDWAIPEIKEPASLES